MNFRRKFTALFRKEKLDAEMTEELRQHIDLRTDRNIANGMSPEEARYAARCAFGGEEQLKERCRDQHGWRWLDLLRQDLRQAIRGLRKNLGFTFAAVASLALGIGANTAMFSVVHGVMLRPLSYPESERLVTLWSENRRIGSAQQPSSYANIVDWRKATRTLGDIAVFDPVSVIVTSEEPRRTSALFASPNLAAVLRVQPLLGRMFTDDEAARGVPVAVLSNEAWQRHHGGAAGILGRTINVDGRRTEIVGVMPGGLDSPANQVEIWVPHTTRGLDRTARGVGSWRGLARLAPGATLAEAQTELAGIAAALEREHSPADAGLGIRLVPLAEQIVGRDLRSALLLLLAAVVAVLLIACSNVGNLLLARGLTRQREFALRLSLGANRGRLAAQLLTENVVLCVVAAGVGLILASVTVNAVRTMTPGNIPRLDEITVDLRMLAFAVCLALTSVCVFGLLPALQCTRRDALSMLRNSSRDSSDTPHGRRLRNLLVVVEFALAVMLFAGAGMLVRSFVNLMAVDPGFRTENLLVAPLRLAASRPERDAIPFAAALLERIRALPGVTGVTVSEEAMLGERNAPLITADRRENKDPGPIRVPLGIDAVTPEYFQVMDVPLRAGRIFSAFDGPNAPEVAIVNETLARQLWRTENPVGGRFRLGPNPQQPWVTVVGVVADQRRQKLDRPPIAQIFWPWAQKPARGMNVIVRTQADPAGLATALRGAVREVDPSVPVETLTTMRQLLDHTVSSQRFHTRLLTTFAVIALVLAGVGIFGLMHYAVARRTQEIGIRTALGATGGQILRDVLAEGMKLAALGVAMGVAGAVGLFRTFSAMLYETSPTDPVSLVGAAIVLIAVAMLACFLPARRASRIDPLVALRSE